MTSLRSILGSGVTAIKSRKRQLSPCGPPAFTFGLERSKSPKRHPGKTSVHKRRKSPKVPANSIAEKLRKNPIINDKFRKKRFKLYPIIKDNPD